MPAMYNWAVIPADIRPVCRPSRRASSYALWASFLLLPVVLAAGCRGADPRSADRVAAPEGQAAATATTGPETGRGTSATEERPLVLWTVPELNPYAPAGEGLADALDAFRDTRSDLGLEVAVKPAYGPAGIRKFLESTARVVPEQLPDVAVLSTSVLRGMASGGLLQQIPPGVPDDRIDDTFAFARSRARDETGRWAVPFALDVAHAIAREAEPPVAWADALDDGPYGLAVGEAHPAGLSSVLTFYGAAGGELGDLPEADQTAAEEAFRFLADGTAGGVFVMPPNGGTPRDTWNTFLNAELAAAAVSGGVFAAQQANFPGLQWGPLPGPTGPARPVGWGWAFVVTSRTPERAARAAELITWLTAPERRGWVTASFHLPAWQSGWVAESAAALDPPPAQSYLEFLAAQLRAAESVDETEDWGTTWNNAALEVLTGGEADAAVATIMP